MEDIEKIKQPAKRTSRGRAIIDIDDLRILMILLSEKKKNLGAVYLADMEFNLNISRKSILNHLSKMTSFGWILLDKSKKPEEYKRKVVIITHLGEEILFKLHQSKVYTMEDGDVVINSHK